MTEVRIKKRNLYRCRVTIELINGRIFDQTVDVDALNMEGAMDIIDDVFPKRPEDIKAGEVKRFIVSLELIK